MRKVYFITGGARSGKSSWAEKLANDIIGKRAYIATAQALDAEMAVKIEKHRQDRHAGWDTFEEPDAVEALLKELSGKYDVVLLDCLTLWLSNIMVHSNTDDTVIARFGALVDAVKHFDGVCIAVANEVGLGIVPDNPLARRFRDCAGMLNQRMARAADDVYMTVAGIPVRIK